MTKFTLVIVALFCVSFSTIEHPKKDDGNVKSILIGKKIAETPLHEYIHENLRGDHIILFLVYGCAHCIEATKAVKKLKEDHHLIDTLIILGSEAGEAGTKQAFIETTGVAKYRIIDYDWAIAPRKFAELEPTFTSPPLVFYVHDNVIKKIFSSKMPSAKSFRKIKEEANKVK